MVHKNVGGITRWQIMRRAAATVAAAGLSDLLATDAHAARVPDVPEDASMHTQSNTIASATPHSVAAGIEGIAPHPLTPLSIRQVVIDDEFWSPKLKIWHEVTIGDCLYALKCN